MIIFLNLGIMIILRYGAFWGLLSLILLMTSLRTRCKHLFTFRKYGACKLPTLKSCKGRKLFKKILRYGVRFRLLSITSVEQHHAATKILVALERCCSSEVNFNGQCHYAEENLFPVERGSRSLQVPL